MTAQTALRDEGRVSDTTWKYACSSRRMTPQVLREICSERHMWSQPHLNTQLFLNYKGFDAIEGLEDYVAVRSLHLGNNNIAKIEGLDRMSDLRSLHLEGNRIARIENLQGNLELRQLNLESNGIRCIDGLAQLLKLEHLNLAKNNLESLENLEGLRSLPCLANVDVSHNHLESTEGVVEFWSGLTSPVKVLRYHGNPGVRNIEHYRKRMVNALPSLNYLDERPVFPVERKSCAAWAEGGLQAMQKAKRDFHEEQHRAHNSVDPERRELLTRMRKAAMARIEREAKEREAKEQEEQKSRFGTPRATSSSRKSAGDAGNPVDISGAADTGSMGGAGEDNCRAGTAYAFRPPPRATSRGPAECAAPLAGRQGAADFIRPCSSSFADGDASAEHADRQIAAMGDDPWVGTEVADSAYRESLRKEFSSGGAKQEPEVMPLLWERLQPAARAAELQALEANLANARTEELAAMD